MQPTHSDWQKENGYSTKYMISTTSSSWMLRSTQFLPYRVNCNIKSYSSFPSVHKALISHLRIQLKLPRCSHCLWHLVTSQTPPPVPSLVGHDHLYMPGVQHHDHPASVGYKLWHSGQRDSELVNSSHCPPHSGPLRPLWAVHGQSLHGLHYKPTASSPSHSEGRLEDMTLPL